MNISHFFSRGLSTRASNADNYAARNRSTTNSLGLFALAGLICLGLAAPAQAHATPCTSGSAMKGSYGLYVTGTTPTAPIVAKYLTGSLLFDGACGVTGTVVVGEHSTMQAFVQTSGTYAMNSDNSLTVTLYIPGNQTPETYNVVYTPLFNEAVGTETDLTAVASIDLKGMVTTGTTHPNYSNANMKGSWAVSCLFSDSAYITFDGLTNTGFYNYFGTVTGTDRSAANITYNVTGIYFLNSDGSIGMYLTYNGITRGVGGVFDNNQNEFQFITNDGTQDLEACSAKRIK